MENVINRYRNRCERDGSCCLFVQVVGLGRAGEAARKAKQRKRDAPDSRMGSDAGYTPSKGVVHAEESISANGMAQLADLRHVRNRRTRICRISWRGCRWSRCGSKRMPNQARRLQVLLGFKEKYHFADAAGAGDQHDGQSNSRVAFTIDKGSHDGVKPDMPVITPDGIMGKVLRVYSAEFVAGAAD